MSSSQFNYARYFGIDSLAAAIVFTIAYANLFLFFIVQSFRRPTTVHFFLAFFCQVRVAAYAIRAALANSPSAGQILGLFIADLVLFGAGFVGLIFSAYILVLDRERILNYTPPRNILTQFTGNKHLLHLVLVGAVVLGVIGAAKISTTDPSGGKSFRIASNFVYLGVTVLLAYRTFLLLNEERVSKTRYGSESKSQNQSFGKKNGAYILAIITLLLLIRVAFTTATSWDIHQQYNEHLWYPLYALPELLATTVYGTPGLVPSRKELKEEAPTPTGTESYRLGGQAQA